MALEYSGGDRNPTNIAHNRHPPVLPRARREQVP